MGTFILAMSNHVQPMRIYRMAERWTTLGLEIWEKKVKPLDGDSRKDPR